MKECNVLFIGQDYRYSNEGLTVVTKRNLRLLEQCGFKVDTILVPSPSIKTKVKNFIFDESYGFTSEIKEKVNQALEKKYDFVFFDRSIFGHTIRKFCKRGVKTISFFHNVEVSLSKDRLKVTRNPLYLMMYALIARNEKMTLKYADSIIAISERDQLELEGLYNRNHVFLMPTSFEPLPFELSDNATTTEKPYCLFVGTNFFANLEGIKWFIEEVAPCINIDVRIVGSICNPLASMKLPSNLSLEGRVDDLNPYYNNAACVISPIFSGSGLKTKTIEALRYGKTIFGTDEAFVGVAPDCYDKIGRLCNTKDDFISAINEYAKNTCLINKGSVEVFNKYFSDEKALKTLKNILNRL